MRAKQCRDVSRSLCALVATASLRSKSRGKIQIQMCQLPIFELRPFSALAGSLKPGQPSSSTGRCLFKRAASFEPGSFEAVVARSRCTPRPLLLARPLLHLRLPRPGLRTCGKYEAAEFAQSLLFMLDTACSATLLELCLRSLLKYLQARYLSVRCYPKLQPRKAPSYPTYLESNHKECWP